MPGRPSSTHWRGINLQIGNFMIDTNFVLHYNRVMKNVTITLKEEVAYWARIKAAEENTSVSRLVGELLQEKMLDEQNYELAMQQYLAQTSKILKKPDATYPSREDLYA
jgi:hypothetical protein